MTAARDYGDPTRGDPSRAPGPLTVRRGVRPAYDAQGASARYWRRLGVRDPRLSYAPGEVHTARVEVPTWGPQEPGAPPLVTMYARPPAAAGEPER